MSNAIKYWKKMLKHYKEQQARGYYLGTDYLPLEFGGSIEQSIDWINEELRLLNNK